MKFAKASLLGQEVSFSWNPVNGCVTMQCGEGETFYKDMCVNTIDSALHCLKQEMSLSYVSSSLHKYDLASVVKVNTSLQLDGLEVFVKGRMYVLEHYFLNGKPHYKLGLGTVELHVSEDEIPLQEAFKP